MSPYVFCSPRGQFLHDLDRVWRPAVQAANIPNFRFPDLRHTFASRFAMAGVDLYTVQRAGGWKTQVMVQRAVRTPQPRSHSGGNGAAGTEHFGERNRHKNRHWSMRLNRA